MYVLQETEIRPVLVVNHFLHLSYTGKKCVCCFNSFLQHVLVFFVHGTYNMRVRQVQQNLTSSPYATTDINLQVVGAICKCVACP